ncbi:hypothetical protein EW146_g10420 [Bondarzewia mesenterica]|uniref:Uncharacterized protein n=1 Tax=Bondarzewia mesenterica TaxID=1095465 RepID=A0A4S4KXH6_9AGAM|nr:hypothetical protein EW146_g10420 [Bondarzewia mesenterica]
MSAISKPEFAGLSEALDPHNDWEQPADEEVQDDIDGEQEALLLPVSEAFLQDDVEMGGPEGQDNKDRPDVPEKPQGLEELKDVLMSASKGVTDETD